MPPASSSPDIGYFGRRRAVWDSALPSHVKLVALAMLSFAGTNGGSIYPSVARVARMVGKSKRSVQTALRVLEKEGFLIIESQGGGRYKTTLYRFGSGEPAGVVSAENGEAGFTVREKSMKRAEQTTKPSARNGETGRTRSVQDPPNDQTRRKQTLKNQTAEQDRLGGWKDECARHHGSRCTNIHFHNATKAFDKSPKAHGDAPL